MRLSANLLFVIYIIRLCDFSLIMFVQIWTNTQYSNICMYENSALGFKQIVKLLNKFLDWGSNNVSLDFINATTVFQDSDNFKIPKNFY